MRVAVVGGGPAGLYCGLLLKKLEPAHDITVIERNPPDATYGWGVVFSERTLAAFQEVDYRSAREIADRFVIWDSIDVYHHGERIRVGGQAFSGISRKVLLSILQRRCADEGVALRFRTEAADLASWRNADLLVGADGVHSTVRKTFARVFKPHLEMGQAKYIWLGTTKLLDAFTFIFKHTEHGLFQAHAYPFDGTTSTFIVECHEDVWRRARLDQMSEEDGIAYCERLFAEELSGAPLISNHSRWMSFPTVTCNTWRQGSTVLIGDAAHTAHFSIGSGTKLAMEDAIALANALIRHEDLDTALKTYEAERRPSVEAFQEAARDSQRYFEHARRYHHFHPAQFTFHLLTRSGRISYDDLRVRDEAFIARFETWFTEMASISSGVKRRSHLLGPPPVLAPIALRTLSVPNRIAMTPAPAYLAEDGLPAAQDADSLVALAERGAGLVLSTLTAISPNGRITPRDLGMYRPEHCQAWTALVQRIHATDGARIGLQLNHAGRRGSTRPRGDGLDRPLRTGNWSLVAPSALPYSSRNQTPRAISRQEMDEVREGFVRAAQLAADAGIDLLILCMAQGYLLGSFLSPLSNLREDEYGGPRERRLRFPLEILTAVRSVWPSERPLGVTLPATDRVEGGWDLDDAVAAAGSCAAHGCDLVLVSAGHTTPDGIPSYDRRYMAALSDRVRNEARVATLAPGSTTTVNEINTLVAGGRADLCVLLPREVTVQADDVETGRRTPADLAGFSDIR